MDDGLVGLVLVVIVAAAYFFLGATLLVFAATLVLLGLLALSPWMVPAFWRAVKRKDEHSKPSRMSDPHG